MARKLVLFTLVALALGALSVACGSDRDARPEPTPAAPAVPTAAATPSSTPVATARPTTAPTVGPTPAAAPAGFPVTVTITDSYGAQVTFDSAPKRIVAFDSAVVEILFAIGEGGRVVGTHTYVDYPPEVKEIPRVGDAFNVNVEATVALNPDLVFVFSEGAVPALKKAGLKVLYQKSLSEDFNQVAEKIRTWGRITGNPPGAERVAADFESRVERIRQSLASMGPGPSVFQDVGGLWTPGPNTLVGEVFDLLKLRNIAFDISDYAQMSPELIVERNPEVIIATDPKAFTGNPAFNGVSAVLSGRVYTLPSNSLDVAGPRFVQGIEELAALVYPSLGGREQR